jgi:hypothetical protein
MSNINSNLTVILPTTDNTLCEPPPENFPCTNVSLESASNFVTGEEQTNNNEDKEENFTEKPKIKPSKKQERKLLKDSGQEYRNYKEEAINAKQILENTCLKKNCRNKSNTFSEEERKEIFVNFYNLGSSDKQKFFLLTARRSRA